MSSMSIQPCTRGTVWTDGATAKWFATRVWLETSENKQILATCTSGPRRLAVAPVVCVSVF